MIIKDKATIEKIKKIASKDILLGGMVAILRRAKLTEMTSVGGFALQVERFGFRMDYLDALIKNFAKTGVTDKAKNLNLIREELLRTSKLAQKI
jgi:hypothetical protein